MTKTYSPPYPDKFKSGDIAIALTNINYADGTKVKKGQEVLVTETTKSYYNVCYIDWELKGE